MFIFLGRISDQLDPVFYQEKVRIAAYRGTKIGLIREHFDEFQAMTLTGKHGVSYGSLLTSKHPGLDMKT